MGRFNRSFWKEVSDANKFTRVETQVMAHGWVWIYNNLLPQQAPMYKPPVAFLEVQLNKVCLPGSLFF